MTGIKHILFPIDFSDRSCAAAPFVEAMANRYQAKVTLISIAQPIYYTGMGDPGGPIVIGTDTILTDLNERLAFALTREFAHLEVSRIAEIGDPAQVIGEIRPAFAGIDPNLPIIHIHTIHEEIDSFMSHDELISRLTGIFALLALLLAAIGLYGVISYSVIRRTSEIGIRLALGAQTRAVLWMVLRESLLLLAIGLALGLPLAFASTRLIREQLFGITALDPSTFAVAIAVVAAMTVFAAWLPARRATKVDPMIALRCD